MNRNVLPFALRDRELEPPANHELEQAVLGALLQNNRHYDELAVLLSADDFDHGAHARIFEAAGQLIERGSSASALTLKDALAGDADVAAQGGIGYLAKLQASSVGSFGLTEWAASLRDLAIRRRAMETAELLLREAAEVDLDTTGLQVLEAAEQRLAEIAEARQQGDEVVGFAAAMRETVSAIEENFRRGGDLVGLSTGYAGLDELTGGLEPGSLTILAARPGMGKTSLALGVAVRAAQAGKRVLFFSMEMRRRSLMQRILVLWTRIRYQPLARGRLSPLDMQLVIDTARDVEDLPLIIDETTPQTPQSALARARRLKRRGGLDLLVFDHLGYMQAGRRQENRNLEVGAITKALKAMAKSLDLPVLLLSQLSRQVESRDDKRPLLSDLRDSGEIEQDADAVWFLYRHHYYLKRGEPQARAGETKEKFSERFMHWSEECERTRDQADVIVAKQRNGAADTVKLAYDEASMRFDDRE